MNVKKNCALLLLLVLANGCSAMDNTPSSITDSFDLMVEYGVDVEVVDINKRAYELLKKMNCCDEKEGVKLLFYMSDTAIKWAAFAGCYVPEENMPTLDIQGRKIDGATLYGEIVEHYGELNKQLRQYELQA